MSGTPTTATGEKQAVTIDDACAFLARFENGTLAIFESTHHALGAQYVCDAVLESAKTKQWVDVKKS
jgi:predicted dehydrogenase